MRCVNLQGTKLLAQMFFRHFSVAKIKYLQFNLTIHPKPQ